MNRKTELITELKDFGRFVLVFLVTCFFTPSQPLRLYQGDCKRQPVGYQALWTVTSRQPYRVTSGRITQSPFFDSISKQSSHGHRPVLWKSLAATQNRGHKVTGQNCGPQIQTQHSQQQTQSNQRHLTTTHNNVRVVCSIAN